MCASAKSMVECKFHFIYTNMKEFQAVARVVEATSPCPVHMVDFSKGVQVASGWWTKPERAEAELDYLIEKQLGKGLYHLETIIKERVAA